MTVRLLMVCLGNICRSPTAEVAVRHAIAAARLDAVVASRGTAGWHEGKGADRRTIAHAARRGLDLRRHAARQLRADDFGDFDHIYAMDQANLAEIQRRCPSEHLEKVQLFLPDGEVPDPWDGDADAFEAVLDLCQARARTLVASLSPR